MGGGDYLSKSDNITRVSLSEFSGCSPLESVSPRWSQPKQSRFSSFSPPLMRPHLAPGRCSVVRWCYPVHTGGCGKAWHTDSGPAVPPAVGTVRHVHPVHRHSLDCRVKRAGNRPCTPCNARVCACVCARACFCLRVHRTDSHIRLTYPDAGGRKKNKLIATTQVTPLPHTSPCKK